MRGNLRWKLRQVNVLRGRPGLLLLQLWLWLQWWTLIAYLDLILFLFLLALGQRGDGAVSFRFC